MVNETKAKVAAAGNGEPETLRENPPVVVNAQRYKGATKSSTSTMDRQRFQVLDALDHAVVQGSFDFRARKLVDVLTSILGSLRSVRAANLAGQTDVSPQTTRPCCHQPIRMIASADRVNKMTRTGIVHRRLIAQVGPEATSAYGQDRGCSPSPMQLCHN